MANIENKLMDVIVELGNDKEGLDMVIKLVDLMSEFTNKTIDKTLTKHSKDMISRKGVKCKMVAMSDAHATFNDVLKELSDAELLRMVGGVLETIQDINQKIEEKGGDCFLIEPVRKEGEQSRFIEDTFKFCVDLSFDIFKNRAGH